MAISNSLAVTQGKGGVGKTTVVANLAGLFAAAGYRVLVGEFDPQGNLSRDFGYEKQSGEELLMALMSGGRPQSSKTSDTVSTLSLLVQRLSTSQE